MKIPVPPKIYSAQTLMQTFHEIDRYMREVHKYIISIKEDKDDKKKGRMEGPLSM